MRFGSGNTAGTVPDPDNAMVNVDVSNIQEIHWNVEFDTYWWLDAMNRKTDTPTRQGVGVTVFIPKTQGGCQPPYDVAIAQHGHTNYRKNMGLSVANEMAAGAMEVIRKRGHSVPGDISVVGFDNVRWARYLYPKLTTVEFPVAEMSRMAALWVLKTVYGRTEYEIQHVFHPSLVTRESAAPPGPWHPADTGAGGDREQATEGGK